MFYDCFITLVIISQTLCVCVKIKLLLLNTNTTDNKICFTIGNNMFALLLTFLLIRNGNSDDNLKKYPFAVGVGYIEGGKKFHTCAGCLLQENWLITAGDCIEHERTYFVTITHNKGTENRRVFDRYVKDNLDFNNDDSTLLGLMKIDFVSNSIKTYPKLITKHLPPFDVRFIYVEYVAGLEDESKNNKVKVVNLVSSPCIKEITESLYVCVNDQRHALSTRYGGPLLYNGTLVGVYSADIIDVTVKRFISIRSYSGWINQKMGLKVKGKV